MTPIMDDIDIVIEDARWQGADLDPLAMRAFGATLDHLGLGGGDWEIVLLACDDGRIAALNTEFRDKPQPTNVLSWPAADLAPDTPGAQPRLPQADLPGMGAALGDIAIAYDTCAREAAEAGKPFTDHVSHLLVHGLLHLLGYDHICDEDAALMEGLETEILATIGIADPYA